MPKKHITYSKGIVYIPILINAVTDTASSIVQLIAGARTVGIEFFSSNVDSTQDRAGNIKLTVSMDGGETFRDYNMLIDNIVADAGVGTSGQDIGHTRIANKGLTAGSEQSAIVWMDPLTVPGITHIKAVFTRTTAGTKGTFTARAVICY